MPELVYTSLEDIEKIHEELRAGFRSGKLNSIEYRKYQLLQIGYLVQENFEAFENALKADLGRPVLESRFVEINTCIGDALKAYKNVEKWAKPEYPAFNINFFAMKPTINKVPKGTVLIIAPFNYPLWLTIGPLVGAIAAGNTVLLKPSESTPAVSSLLAELVPKYLDSDLVRVVNGAVAETSKILELQWDHILYTGSGRVGKIVATAAAKHLTPVSLELGGKSPVIVDPTCDLQTATRRILWGKCTNAGQTCVAPDYILVPRSFQNTFIEALTKTYNEFFPSDAKPSDPDNFARMITPQAFNRVKGLLDATKGTVVLGGETDAATKFIAPTIVKDVLPDDSLMSDEIFGPILPIVAVEDIDEAIRFVNSRDHPLALYVFTQDQAVKDRVFRNTQSGAYSVNEVVIHTGVDGLPFGGTGPSGYGEHTGKFSFDMFTHLRSSIDSPSWVDAILKFRYPPYTAKKLKATENFKVKLPAKPKGPPSVSSSGSRLNKWFVLALAVAVAAGLTKRARALIA
ncbi:aldehyde dehydrogenase [Coprinopsis cinerea okayama7|uniref:Aldehyde dehydrogenase n=1 Tax=Coprinopsis cinerea (strain Okayama-7 / 130 / ATCC MYA-4618 / FGSC 9003) TaxID=240176 RepID=A8NBV6_COPC7|nr:aldehyde dehydrogenase [Coprinopsis cinerea okayama7\|eukprot:XP_001832316.1 aldehyde dehydrogenase [Coprinopsis cinerea okayama7\